MARETKIGLIVGLTFIICFAVILANRGRPRSRSAHVPYAVDRGVSGTQVAERGGGLSRPGLDPGPPAMISPVTSGVPTFTAPVEVSPTGTVASSSHGPSRGSPRVRWLPASEAQKPSAIPASRAKLLEELASKLNDRAGPGSATVIHTPSTPAVNPLADNMAGEQSDPSRRTDAATRQPIRRRPARTTQGTLRHTVVAGETLSKIATHYYGSRSGNLVRALYAANRSVMKSPNLLRVGVKLHIPRIVGFTTPVARGVGGRSAKEHTAGAPSRRAEPKTTPAIESEATVRWYQVKKSDRYASIARRLLGNSARWREIFELNKDKFPDPDRIREGVRIRIPAAPAVTSGGTRP